MNKFPALMDEVNCINNAYGWNSILDALEYIYRNEESYLGTQCLIEFRQFYSEMKAIFE
jgi:hypothetical protein